METVIFGAESFGSVFSGGRYNDLVSRFTGKELPATGASVGVDRLFTALKHLGIIDNSQQTVTSVMVLRLVKDRDEEYLEMADEIRAYELNTEVCLLEDTTFKSQFNFAIGRGVNFVIISGEQEFKKDTVQVRNLDTREQVEIDRDDLGPFFEEMLMQEVLDQLDKMRDEKDGDGEEDEF
jgi:histidyl-tRNA synthetase